MEYLFSIPTTLCCLFINMVKNRNFPTTVAKKALVRINIVADQNMWICFD